MSSKSTNTRALARNCNTHLTLDSPFICRAFLPVLEECDCLKHIVRVAESVLYICVRSLELTKTPPHLEICNQLCSAARRSSAVFRNGHARVAFSPAFGLISRAELGSRDMEEKNKLLIRAGKAYTRQVCTRCAQLEPRRAAVLTRPHHVWPTPWVLVEKSAPRRTVSSSVPQSPRRKGRTRVSRAPFTR